MRTFFRRSIVWLIPVILVPLAALLVLQYRFLRKLEKTTASAEVNWLRTSLEEITQNVESYYRATSKKTLTMSADTACDPVASAAHFRANPLDGAKTYFTIHFADPWIASYFGPGGWPKGLTAAEMEAVKMASSSWVTAHKINTVFPSPQVHVDERDPKNRVIIRPITDDAMHVVGIAGVVLDENLSKATLLRIGAESLKGREHANDLALRVGEKFPIFPRGREFMTQSLGFVFTNWRIGIRDVCASPEQIAASHFRLNMIWTGCVALVLFAAILLAIQAASRQMRLSQMKSDFVSNVSHELRTPLSSIRVFGEYMRLGRVTKDDKIREYGEYIEAESRRLTQLINNILDFSKIESAEKQYRFAEGNLAEVVACTVSAFEMPLREKGFAIAYRGPSEPLPLVFDKDAIAQAVVNLVDNAVKYSGEQKAIDVRLDVSRDEACVSVRDYGIGIERAEQKKIFEKFYRVGSGLVHDVKGSGLGLAIVSHIAKAHGGRVEVDSSPGAGSTFTIVLPTRRAVAVEAAPHNTTTTTELA